MDGKRENFYTRVGWGKSMNKHDKIVEVNHKQNEEKVNWAKMAYN